MKKFATLEDLLDSDEVFSPLPPTVDPMAALRAALSADLQPLGEALAGAMQAGDEAAMNAALAKISARVPEFIRNRDLIANAYNPLQARAPKGAEGGGRWTKDVAKAKRLKKGVKVGNELYSRENPAPPAIALDVAKKMGGEEPGEMGRILSEMGHRNWPDTVPGASEHAAEILRRFEEGKAQSEQKGLKDAEDVKTRLHISNDDLGEIASETTAYTISSVKEVSIRELVFRGDPVPPSFKSARQAGGDTSKISNSQYPVMEVELSNGSRFFEKIRISDHEQVSSNAPRFYQYDYRANSVSETIESPEFQSDMTSLAGEIWERQKAEHALLKKNAPAQLVFTNRSVANARETSASGVESRQSRASSRGENSDFMENLSRSLSADLQPLGEALAGAMQAGDEAAMQAALKKISARMPEFLNSPELEALLQTEFVKSLTTEDDS